MELGRSEVLLLREVRKLGKASAREVWNHNRLKRKIAYTTITTTLNRLCKKGLLIRETETGEGDKRQKYIYFLSENQELQKRFVDRFLDTLVSAFGPAVISSISVKLDEFEK